MTSRRALLIGGAATAGLMTIGRKASAQAMRLRVGNVYPATHSIPVATERFKQLVEQKSGGAITVRSHNARSVPSARCEMVRGGRSRWC